MLVLHAILEDAMLLVWGERADGDLADHAQLAEAMSALAWHDAGSASADTWRELQLPCIGGERLPSPQAAAPRARDAGRTAAAALGPWRVACRVVAPIDAIELLHDAPQRRLGVTGIHLEASFAVIGELARHAAAAVVRQEVVPSLRRIRGSEPARFEARWGAITRPASADAVDAIAGSLPDAVFASRQGVLAPNHVTRAARTFVDGIVDALVRRRLAAHPAAVAGRPKGSLHDRWVDGLVSPDPTVAAPEDALLRLADEVDAWQARLRRGSESPFRLCFRLEEPDDPSGDTDVWYLRYLLQAREDPSVLVDLADAWKPVGAEGQTLRRHGFHPGEHLYAPLGDAARLFEPVAESLRTRAPAGVELDTTQAHAFLAEVSPMLEQAGFGVFIPAWWRGRSGRFQLGVRAQVTGFQGGRRNLDSLNLDTLVGYDWRLAVGDAELSEQELHQLARQKTPLVHVRGRWVELDPEELRVALAHIERLAADPTTASRGGAHAATVGELLGMAVGAPRLVHGLPVKGVTVDGDIATLLARLQRNEVPDLPAPPAGLRADLRPYQLRGYAWLDYMSQLGLGACLADDMGLGKSVQALAVIQRAWELASPGDRAPTLVVCPTSVVTNWAREAARFTPDLPIVIHHGPQRKTDSTFATQAGSSAIVFTTYALLARDLEDLQRVPWRMVVLDEAQNIKNPGTRHAIAARALVAPARVVLTGTPIENHVGDLWSIMEFLNPGLLGSRADFGRRYLVPIQTGSFPEAGERLRTLTAPFILRREKTDRSVIDDLPDKVETSEYCTLTTEQVGLYEAIVRDAERVLRGRAQAGVERRGMILATLAKLKQACNHPAQLLGDNSQVAGRSGKLARLEELLEAVLDSGERALVFTQFVQMGELLQRHLRDVFGREVLFLHGGTTRKRRDEIVEAFQVADAGSPPILVLSLKAGGSGLNLTAASHVVHYDRWWNPATEQQASDRAFRIGQTRDVQVHAFVCAGTIEEQVDRMLRQKRQVASSIVGSGERWITELGDDELIDLLRLREQTLLQDGRLDDISPKEWKRANI
ncbi:MAG: helicase, superfamily [Thermoleophilia bacterium]|nr:helicase, superfamily [Thermoleophilia bacterium]